MSKKKNKPSRTIDRNDILPDFPQDQVQSNGLENAEQKAKHTGPAPD